MLQANLGIIDNIIMYSILKGDSFWDLLKITFNSFIKLAFLKMTVKLMLDDGKSHLNVKIGEIRPM